MVCREYQEQLIDFVLDETGAEQSAEVQSHLRACPLCAAEVESIRSTVRLLREADEIANRVSPDPHFRSRVVRKIPQRRRESVMLMRRRSASRTPLIAALSAAAILLAVVIYVLSADSSYFDPKQHKEKVAEAPESDRSPVMPHPVESTGQRLGQDLARPSDAPPQPSEEADQMGSETEELVEGPELEPVGPVPAPSPDLKSEKEEDLGPIPVPGEPYPELVTKPHEKPFKEWVAQLYSARGEVQVRRGEQGKWVRASESDKFFRGESIRTSRGGAVASLSAGGTVVLNRSSALSFLSHTECELEKGEILASSHGRPLVLESSGVRVTVDGADAYVQRRTRDTRIIAAGGIVRVDSKGHKRSVASGKGVVIDADGKAREIDRVNLEEEIEWISDAAREFKLWVEGECCRHNGYCAIQQNDPNLSNLGALHKVNARASLSWRLRLPHTMPCYVWVRYSRSSRDPEDVALVLNRSKVQEKTIKAAGAKWFWVKAFKATLGRCNDMKLFFSSTKHVRSRVDLILITNDPDFVPSRDIPKGGYYGSK